MSGVSGWLILGTKMDSTQLEKDLKNQKKALERYEKEAEDLLTQQAKAEQDLEPYKEEIEYLRERKEYIDQAAMSEQQRQADYKMLQSDLNSLNNEYSKQIQTYEEINEKIKSNAVNQKLMKQEIEKTTVALQRASITQNLESIGKSITKVVKKVGRWALAIFGIRGAYMAVRNAINVISQDDKQLKADIDYMKNIFAYTLEPVVRKIVELAKQLMYAIQNIVYTLTGKNVFENANKSLEKANKNAKALNKTMGKFDEMQTVGNKGGSDSGDPSMNLGKINEMSSTGKGLVGVILAIGGAIAALKLSEVLKTIGLINSELTIMQGLGIFAIIFGLYKLITDLIDIWKKFDTSIKDNNTTLRDWGNVVRDIGIIILGVALLIASWPVAIAAAIVLIIGLLMKYWDQIKTFFTEKVFGWMDKMIEKLEKTTIGGFFAQIFRDSKAMIGEILNIFDGLFKSIKQIFDGITKLLKGDSSGWKDIFKGVVNFFITTLNGFITGINTMMTPFRALIVAFGKVTGKNWNMDNIRIPQIKYLAKGGIINMPGKGVPLAGGLAKGGEDAPEGVIPLTDSQQMALLGEAIGKFVNINATIPVYIGNRLVLREMKRMNAEDNFAYNR